MSRVWFLIVIFPALPCAAQTPRKEATSSLVPAKGAGAISSLTPASGSGAQPVRTGTSGMTPAAPVREGTSGLVRPGAQSSLVKPAVPAAITATPAPAPPPAVILPASPHVEVAKPIEKNSPPPVAIVAQPAPVQSTVTPPVISKPEAVAAPSKTAEVAPRVTSKVAGEIPKKPTNVPKKSMPAVVASPTAAAPVKPSLITREEPLPKSPIEEKHSDLPAHPTAEASSAKDVNHEPAKAEVAQPSTSTGHKESPKSSAALSKNHEREPKAGPPPDTNKGMPNLASRMPAKELAKKSGDVAEPPKESASSKKESAAAPLPIVLHEAPMIRPPVAASVDLSPTQPVAAHIAETTPKKSAAEAARSPLFKPLPVQAPAEAVPPTASVPLTSQPVMEVAKLESALSSKPAPPEPPVIDAPKLEAPKLEEPKTEQPKIEEPKIDLPNLPKPMPVVDEAPSKAKPQRPQRPTPHAAHDDLRLPPAPPKPAPAPVADSLPPAPAPAVVAQPAVAVESIAPPMPAPVSVDTAQVAPEAPAGRKQLLYGANFGNDPDSADLAAEVAAILSNAPSQPEAVRPARVARPKVVSFPSEQWLREASAGIERLPESERPAAFQKVIERYKRMRAEEKNTPR